MKLAVGFLSLLVSPVRGESKYSLVAGGQRDDRIERAKQTVGSSVAEETSKSHAHDDVTHAMTMTRTGWREDGEMRTSPVRLQQRCP